MYVPTCFDTVLLFLYSSYFRGKQTSYQSTLISSCEVFYAIVQIYMIVYTFLLQEELYSYCNRVKRSILEVSYIVLYRSYPDRQRLFISTWEENEWITGKKDEIDCSKEQS